jgi:regulatory protein
MPVISEISKQKKGNRYNIFLDGEFAVGVSQDTLAEFGLYKGKDFTSIKLEEVIKFDFFQRILAKALRLVAASPKTVKTLRFKLDSEVKNKSEDYSIEIDAKAIVEEVLVKLQDLGYVDDLRFATEFVNSRLSSRPRSKELIKSELYSKGVDKETIDAVLLDLAPDDYNNASMLLEKKYGTNKILKGEDKKINFLRGKGYNWDVISKFLKDDFAE